MHSKSRRNFLLNSGLLSTGLTAGGLAMAGVLPGGATIASAVAEGTTFKGNIEPHFPARAKTVIWLHQEGAPSSLDLFDYKPELIRLAGTETPASYLQGIQTFTQGGPGKLIASKREWKQYGESGAWFSDLMPHLAQHADDLAFIKSSVTIGATHDISVMKLNTGDLNPGRPTLGAWIQYALGTANPNLPAYVVLYNDSQEPRGGVTNWGSGFLPASYQGTAFRPGLSPILHLENPHALSREQWRSSLDLLASLNERLGSNYAAQTELAARTASYELAYRMQETAPEAVDYSRESDATKELYGLNDEVTRSYGEVLLRARRLAERGVRFIQVVSGRTEVNGELTDWDAHSGLEENHRAHSRVVDKPIAGLLADLKSRGLLDSTLVVWTSEFGRTPWSESGDGRDHNPWGYTQWMAGGGIKPGITYGSTDELGLHAEPGKEVDTYDIHATVLNQLGLDHRRVIYRHQGRSERPTVTYGKVIQELVG